MKKEFKLLKEDRKADADRWIEIRGDFWTAPYGENLMRMSLNCSACDTDTKKDIYRRGLVLIYEKKVFKRKQRVEQFYPNSFNQLRNINERKIINLFNKDFERIKDRNLKGMVLFEIEKYEYLEKETNKGVERIVALLSKIPNILIRNIEIRIGKWKVLSNDKKFTIVNKNENGRYSMTSWNGLDFSVNKESVKIPDGIDDNMENFISDCCELMEALKEIQVPYKKFEMLAKKFDDLIEEL